MMDENSIYVFEGTDSFTHVFDYIVHGVYPIFFASGRFHQIGEYAKVLAEADYFQVEGLAKWLREKKYLQAFKEEFEWREVEGLDHLDSVFLDRYTQANEETHFEFHPTMWTKKTYVCPRGISVHYGQPNSCGQACAKAECRDYEDRFVKELVWNTAVMVKRIVVDEKLCREVRKDESGQE